MQPDGGRNDAKGKAGEAGDKRCRERRGHKQDQINSEMVTHRTHPICSAAIGVAAAIGQRLANYRLMGWTGCFPGRVSLWRLAAIEQEKQR